MRLTRMIREKGRVLVLVVMALLLVSFLLQDAIESGGRGDQFNPPVARAFGRTVYMSDLDHARRDITIANSLRIPAPRVMARTERESQVGWYLLLTEAEQLGVTVSRDEVIRLLRESQVPPEHIEAIRTSTGRSLNAIYEAIGRVLAARTLFGYQMEVALGESLPRLEALYLRQNQNATVALSVLNSRAFLPQVEEPSDAELEEFFERCKDRPREHTEEELVFGYLVPERVRIEYLTVDPADAQPRVRISRREAQMFYEIHRDRYVKPLEGPPTEDEADQPVEVPMPFDEAEPQAREDARAHKAIEEAQRLVNEMYEEAVRTITPDTPAEEVAGAFEALREKYSARYPVRIHTTELLDRNALANVPGIGQAQATVRSRSTGLTDIVFRVQGLATPESEEDERALLSLNAPAPVALDTRPWPDGQTRPYQAYLFRVVEAVPAGPPASLDAVREEVRADWRLAQAHALAGEHAQTLADAARGLGLKAAVDAADELKAILSAGEESEDSLLGATGTDVAMLGPTAPPAFRRQASMVPHVGVAPGLHEKVFALAEQPADEGAHRVLVTPLAKNFKWVVAEVHALQPVYRGDFEAKRPTLERSSLFMQQIEFMEQWGSLENIYARTGYESLEDEEQQ